MGLSDFLEERYVVALLNYAHIGNFHPRTGTRSLMDYMYDWKLMYRTEEDMKRIYQMSTFGGISRVLFEDERVDMFVAAIKSTRITMKETSQ